MRVRINCSAASEKIPVGQTSVNFTPANVASRLPDPTTHTWPIGDVLSDEPLPPEIDATRLKQAIDAAFDPPASMTAAFLVIWLGRLIAERYLTLAQARDQHHLPVRKFQRIVMGHGLVHVDLPEACEPLPDLLVWQAPVHVIVPDNGQLAAMQDAELLANDPPHNEQRFHQHGQIGKALDKLPDTRLELDRPDHADLETEV